jgi:hypothetical protein
MHEPELFETYYEINKPHTSPMMWKIVGATLAIHFAAFLTFSQFNLLQTKACDSPYVGKVCEVLDAAYIGSIFMGTDRTSVDKPYEKTELEDADITFVDVSNLEPFKYPEGYFEPEVSENDLAVVDANGIPTTNANPVMTNGIPGIPNSGNPTFSTPKVTVPPMPNIGSIGGKKGGFGKNAKLPKPAINVITTDDLDGFEIVGKNPTTDKNNKAAVVSTVRPDKGKLPNKSPGKLPILTDKQSEAVNGTKPKVDESKPVTAVEINKAAWDNLADDLIVKVSAKEVDLTQPFTVVLDGTLTKDGKFDNSIDKNTKKPKSQFIKSDGDQKMVDVAKQALEALGDSGWLGYLRNIGVEKVNFTLIQDGENIRAIIVSDQPDEDRAKTIYSGMNALIAGAKFTVKGKDEQMLLQGAKVTREGKNFIMNVVIPKPIAQDMINRQLQDKQAKAKATTTPQSNSVADGKNANTNTVK